MAILEKEIWVVLCHKNIAYYEKLGYQIPKTIDKKGKLKIPGNSKILVSTDDLQLTSSVKVTKVCDICGQKTKNQPYERIIKYRKGLDNNDRCNKCKYKKSKKNKQKKISNNGVSQKTRVIKNIPFERTLESKAIEKNKEYLLKEYSNKNKLKINEISFGSAKKYYWNCVKCGSEFIMSPFQRVVCGNNCPYCSGRKINETNNLHDLFPEISSEWHPTKNGNIKPNKVFYKSSKKIWWRCSFGHEWQTSISSRTLHGSKCHGCTGYKRYSNNWLAIKNPEISKEWHTTLNGDLTPENVTNGSGKIVWWICKEGHSYQMSVYKRTGRGFGCSVCAEPRGEKRVREWLELNKYEIVKQKEFKGLKGTGGGLLSYDFYIPRLNILIEYQGEQHEIPIDFYNKGKEHAELYLKIQQEHDRRKREYAKLNNITLLEIWYWDYDNIENILAEKLNE